MPITAPGFGDVDTMDPLISFVDARLLIRSTLTNDRAVSRSMQTRRDRTAARSKATWIADLQTTRWFRL
jgi:hypothetical protein